MSAEERDLKPALDALATPAARPAFRDELRARFLAAQDVDPAPELAPTLDADELAPTLDADELAPTLDADELATTLDADELATTLDALEVPAARPGFRAELRERFLAAGVERTPVSSTRARRGSLERPARARRAPTAARSQRLRLQLLVGAAAAAVIALWFLRPGAEPAPWSVVGGEVAALRVDGRALPADLSPLELARRLTDAVDVTAEGADVRLRAGDLFVVEIAAGSTLRLSGVADDLSGDVALEMVGDEGGFRISTGPAFDGAHTLSFRTPDAEVVATGTAFGIDRYVSDDPRTSGTCICCCDGAVLATERATDAQATVSAQRMAFVFSGGLPMAEGDVLVGHAAPIRSLQAIW